MAFFAMAEEALKAKTAANEVTVIYCRLCFARFLCEWYSNKSVGQWHLQSLRADADSLREELQEKRDEYIKVHIQ